MTISKQILIDRATAYFRDVDNFDTNGILSHMTADVVMEVPSHGVRKEGAADVRQAYVNRENVVTKSWHGDFEFTADEAAGQLAIRLAVKRTNADGSSEEMDNLTLLHFEGDLISRVTVWMSGNNSLT